MSNSIDKQPVSINRSFIAENKKLTAEEKKIALSIFDSIDNKNEDVNSQEGVVSGDAVKIFYNNLTKACTSAVGKLATLYTTNEKDEKVYENHEVEQFDGQGWTKTGFEKNGYLGKQEIYERKEGDNIITTYVYRSTDDENGDKVFDDKDAVRTEKVVIESEDSAGNRKILKEYVRKVDTLSMCVTDEKGMITGRDMDNNGVLEGDEIFKNKDEWKWGADNSK